MSEDVERVSFLEGEGFFKHLPAPDPYDGRLEKISRQEAVELEDEGLEIGNYWAVHQKRLEAFC